MAVQGMLFACLQNGVQSGKAQECRSNCSDLWHSISKHGYAVLGCDEEEYKEVKRALKACEAFFALDMATKRAFNGASADQGYSKRSNGEEFLATRLGMPAPAGSQHPAQRPQLEAACCRLDSLARCVLRALCRSPQLQLPPSALEGLLEEEGEALLQAVPSNCMLTASSTSNCADSPAAAPGALPRNSHGALALIASTSAQGLQIKSPASGTWANVPLGPGQVAVVVGHSLSYALGGALQPTVHCVNPPCGRGAGAGAGACAAAGAAAAGGAQHGGRRVLQYELCFRPGALLDPASVLRRATGSEARAAAVGLSGPLSRPRYVSDLADEATAQIRIPALSAGDNLAALLQTIATAAAEAAVSMVAQPSVAPPAPPAVAPPPPPPACLPAAGQARPREVAGFAAAEEEPERKVPRREMEEGAGSVVGPRVQRQQQQHGQGQDEVQLHEDTYMITLRDADGNGCHFRIKDDTSIARVLVVYANMRGQLEGELQLLTPQGAQVDLRARASELGLVDGSVLVVRQVVPRAEPDVIRVVVQVVHGPVWEERVGRRQHLNALLGRVPRRLGWRDRRQGRFYWGAEGLGWDSGKSIAEVGIKEGDRILVVQ